MTVRDVYESALSLLGEFPEQESDEEKKALSLLNTLLADCFDVNNTLRVYGEKEILRDIPYKEGLEDTLEYEESLCRDALPYGLAALIILEDDANRAGFFDFRYQQKKLQYNKLENVALNEVL